VVVEVEGIAGLPAVVERVVYYPEHQRVLQLEFLIH
jgi:hypothetical protein